jgi:hypothetical protein
MNTQIPEVLRYSKSLNALAIPAKQNLRKYYPETSRSGYTTTNRTIRIPISGNDVFIDTNRSSLTFTLTVTAATNPVFLDNSAYSVIDSLRVIDSNGMVLEEINQYNIMANRLADFNVPVDEREGIKGRYAGMTNQGVPSLNGAFSFAAGTTSRTFNLPLVGSGILNMTSKAHNGGVLLPIALTNGLYIEINLVSNINDPFYTDAAAAGTLSAWTVNDISYDATVVSFDANVVRDLQAAAIQAGGIFLSSYSYHGQQISSPSASVSLNMNERAKSIKSIYVTPRLDSQNNNLTGTLFSSLAPTAATNINAYLQLASMVWPNVAIQNTADAARELEKALGTSCSGIVSREEFEDSTAADVVTTLSGGSQVLRFPRYTIGFDLDTVSREMLEAGYDNQSSSIPIQINHVYDSAAARTYVIHSLVDMVVKLDPVAKSMSVSY